MSYSFNFNNRDHLNSKIFLDESGGVSLSRFDEVKYPKIEKMIRKQIGFFWVPEEMDLSKDKRDFAELNDNERHIFSSNLKRQIMLDSIQGRSPNMILLPIVSNPEVETFIETWGFFECIHSRSYTHILRNVYPNPTQIFDTMLDIPEIVDCAKEISKYYDDLYEANLEYMRTGVVTREHKEILWLALAAINALEGLRFYVSFACSWNFAQNKKMMGNANIIRLIARDENQHLAFTSFLLNALPKDDKDFLDIRTKMEGKVKQLYIDVVQQEKEWADYLFQDGGMIGLNTRLCHEYIEFLCNRRLQSIGVQSPYKGNVTSNPLPWTTDWISSEKTQNANQENENTAYVIGAIKPDYDVLKKDTFDIKKLLKEVD